MKYLARPYTDTPYAREKYKHESSVLHELTGDLILCTIPLTEYYEIFFNKQFEQKIFDVAEEMIKQCDLLVYLGDSKGVRKEIALAKKYGVPVVEYYDYIKELKNERI